MLGGERIGIYIILGLVSINGPSTLGETVTNSLYSSCVRVVSPALRCKKEFALLHGIKCLRRQQPDSIKPFLLLKVQVRKKQTKVFK